VLAEYHKHGRLIDAGTIEAAEDSAASAWLGRVPWISAAECDRSTPCLIVMI
jgi:hypothetical protein